MHSWDNAKYAECPSFMEAKDGVLLAASVLETTGYPFFAVMFGVFQNCTYKPTIIGCPDQGPDQYAGQIFRDHQGRCILITWIPGWGKHELAEKNIGCLSVPREVFLKDGKVHCYPVKEVQHLLKGSDPAIKFTEDGFVIKRTKRDDLIYKGEINDIKVIRDEYVLEIFINGGETVYSVLL